MTKLKTREKTYREKLEVFLHEVADMVKMARMRTGLTQAQLAQRMNVKREFIVRLESGKQNTTLETIYRAADALGKKVEVRFR